MSHPDLLVTLTANQNDENDVTVAFTMGGKALEKGHSVDIKLLSNAVHLTEKKYAEKIDIGEPLKPVKDLVDAVLENGGKLKVCSTCMKHNSMREGDLIESSEIITADDVIDGIMGAEKYLQLN